MPRTRECDYCGADIEPGTGTMLVRNDGSTVDFCSSKCENNADLGREARDLEWTASGRGPETAPQESNETDAQEPETEADATEESAAPDLEAAEADAEADGDDAEDEAEADEEDEQEAEA